MTFGSVDYGTQPCRQMLQLWQVQHHLSPFLMTGEAFSPNYRRTVNTPCFTWQTRFGTRLPSSTSFLQLHRLRCTHCVRLPQKLSLCRPFCFLSVLPSDRSSFSQLASVLVMYCNSFFFQETLFISSSRTLTFPCAVVAL